MTFTLGKDLGIVMAKGVVLGVISCVTVLPSMILIFDKPLQKTKHKCIIPDMHPLARKLTKVFPIFLIIFVLLISPAYYGYDKTNDEVYYDMGECLPKDIEYVIANTKLRDEFDIASTHMLLVDASTSSKDVHSMIKEMDEVDGVKYVLGLESVLDSSIPEAMIPESLTKILKSDRWELLLVNSEYKVASDLGQRSARSAERDPEEIRSHRNADRRSAVHEGYDRNHRSRLPGCQRGFHRSDFRNHPDR